ncbi:hypothetical protein KIPB_006822 [Kipferlia bialata]|uniref:Myosin motor domain-containing protein n=1 Tax=Kipferlia bialata TaxID=797122 RepID=A0A9K3CXK1_9EUKA|nr:hypothetical protein KIPB_006822 [Kipferlia bialata]|eukprot:g6822.t1
MNRSRLEEDRNGSPTLQAKEPSSARGLEILHALLAGSTDKELETLKLKRDSDQYPCTVTDLQPPLPGINDAQAWSAFTHALSPYSESLSIQGVSAMLAVILHLSAVEVAGKGKGRAATRAAVQNKGPLQSAARLLGIQTASLEDVLVQRALRPGQESAKLPRTPADAEGVRDALGGAIYARLLRHMVQTVNEHLASAFRSRYPDAVRQRHEMVSLTMLVLPAPPSTGTRFHHALLTSAVWRRAGCLLQRAGGRAQTALLQSNGVCVDIMLGDGSDMEDSMEGDRDGVGSAVEGVLREARMASSAMTASDQGFSRAISPLTLGVPDVLSVAVTETAVTVRWGREGLDTDAMQGVLDEIHTKDREGGGERAPSLPHTPVPSPPMPTKPLPPMPPSGPPATPPMLPPSTPGQTHTPKGHRSKGPKAPPSLPPGVPGSMPPPTPTGKPQSPLSKPPTMPPSMPPSVPPSTPPLPPAPTSKGGKGSKHKSKGSRHKDKGKGVDQSPVTDTQNPLSRSRGSPVPPTPPPPPTRPDSEEKEREKEGKHRRRKRSGSVRVVDRLPGVTFDPTSPPHVYPLFRVVTTERTGVELLQSVVVSALMLLQRSSVPLTRALGKLEMESDAFSTKAQEETTHGGLSALTDSPGRMTRSRSSVSSRRDETGSFSHLALTHSMALMERCLCHCTPWVWGCIPYVTARPPRNTGPSWAVDCGSALESVIRLGVSLANPRLKVLFEPTL